MISLLDQTRAIAALAADMNKPRPCARCAEGFCFWHHTDHIQTRTMTRAQWLALRHRTRERLHQLHEQERDMDNWRESAGYEMPFSVAQERGYVE